MVILDPTSTPLPDGVEVQITVVPEAQRGPIPFTPEEQAEFNAWDKLSDEAWNMIDWGEGEIARDSG